MRTLVGAAATAAAAVLLIFTGPAVTQAAVVGTFTQVGESITTPVAFNAVVFNSFLDVPGGLSFAISPGLSGPVKLDLVQSTANVKVAAAAIGGAFGISQSLPLSLTTPEALAEGIHNFAIGAVTNGSKEGTIIARLTLTPAPGALFLGLSAAAMIGGLAVAGRRKSPLQGA
jgi:hypothetical protein